MAVRVGDQRKSVQGRNATVHFRVRRKAGFKGKDLLAQIAKTLLNGIKSGLGTKQGKPGGPDMGRHQKTLGGMFQEYFKQDAGVQAKDGTTV